MLHLIMIIIFNRAFRFDPSSVEMFCLSGWLVSVYCISTWLIATYLRIKLEGIPCGMKILCRCFPKGYLLGCNRQPFAVQYVAFFKAKYHVLLYIRFLDDLYWKITVLFSNVIGADVQLDLFETAHKRISSAKRIGNRHSSHLQRQKENRNLILATDWPIHSHQKLCKNNGWFVCLKHRQNYCTYRSAICKLYQQ